tara:strand:- start:656 stop:886 length:231 start_codon:yes stop_codon:yes gene_type:complete
MNLDINIGDTILTGRFKNKRIVVKEFGVDEKGQPTINGRPILKFRIEKLMPSKQDKTENDITEFVSKVIDNQINKR